MLLIYECPPILIRWLCIMELGISNILTVYLVLGIFDSILSPAS